MPDGIRAHAPLEPSQRYRPRQTRPLFFDIHATPSSTRNQAPLAAGQAPRKEQPTPPKTAASSNVALDAVSVPEKIHSLTKHYPTRTAVTVRPAIPRQRRSMVLRRQIVDRAEQFNNEVRAQRRRLLLAFGFGSLAATLLLGVAFVGYTKFHAKPQVLAAQSTTKSPTLPAGRTVNEAAVSQADIDAYAVSDDQPRLLRISKLGIVARIYPVQANFNGEPIAAPGIYDVGWLENSVTPGEAGAALFNGSSAVATKSGIFGQLNNLTVGDTVVVEMGDGVTQTFKVVSSKQYDADKVDMKRVTASAIAGRPGLNLLTDTGRFNVRTNSYEQRTVVFAVLE